MDTLEQLILDGHPDAILAAMAGWSDKQKREAWKWCEGLWKWKKGVTGRDKNVDSCLMVASAACARNAKEALLAAPPCEYVALETCNFDMPVKVALIAALASHGREWVIDYLTLFAAGKTRKQHDIDVLLALIDGFDTPLPEGDVFRQWWSGGFIRMARSRLRFGGPVVAPPPAYRYVVPKLRLTGGASAVAWPQIEQITAHSRVEAFSAQASLRRMVARILAQREAVLGLLKCLDHAVEHEELLLTFQDLLESGLLDRASLIDDTISALTRGDSVGAQRLQVDLLRLVAPNEREIALHAATLQGLLASGHGSTAELAQGLLRQLDKQQALAGDVFVALCQMVFARKEKGLRNEQLAWATARIRHHPGQLGASLHGLVEALTVDELKLQGKAAQTLAQYWPQLDLARQDELFVLLEPGLPMLDASICARLLAQIAKPTPMSAPAPAPAPMPATAGGVPLDVVISEMRPLHPFTSVPADVPGLRELLARHASDASVLVCEQIVDTVLRMAAQDRPSLKLALQHCEQWSIDYCYSWARLPELLAGAVFARLSLARLRELCKMIMHTHGSTQPPAPLDFFWHDMTTLPAAVALLRLAEIVCALQEGRSYPLISTPDFDNGSLLPATLAARLAQLAQTSTVAEPLDLLQALMRTQQPGPVQIDALRAIGSHQAMLAADFFNAGGMGQMSTVWQTVKGDAHEHWARCYFSWQAQAQPEVCVTLHGMPVVPAIDAIPVRWTKGFTPADDPEVNEFHLNAPSLTGVMPNQGELLAAFNLVGFRKASHDSDTRGGKAVVQALPIFMDARGPAGPAMHLAILFALSANAPEARLAGSDALLELIGQGRYQSQLASELVAATIAVGSVKVARLAKSLIPLVDAGVGTTLWPLLCSGVGAALAPDSAPPGTPELLALASRVAASLNWRETSGAAAQSAAKTAAKTVAKTAARKGGGKLLLEARRLHQLLNGEVA